jgi:potassium voltage-gated channel Eag-related subfamily H protein 8
MLILSYILKIFKLVIIILNLSYLFGVFWLVLCEAVFDFQYDIDVETYVYNTFEEELDLFLLRFEMIKKSESEGLIIASYFAFTSLSTVGLGDYHPRGNLERLATGFILLFGVAIFSYIMGNFIEILSEFKEFHKDIGDGDNLSKFFGTLKYFNGQKNIDQDFKNRIEMHFDYRWREDKLAAFKDDSDINLQI